MLLSEARMAASTLEGDEDVTLKPRLNAFLASSALRPNLVAARRSLAYPVKQEEDASSNPSASDVDTPSDSSSPSRSWRRATNGTTRSLPTSRSNSIGAVRGIKAEAPPEIPALMEKDRDRLADLLRRQREKAEKRSIEKAAKIAKESKDEIPQGVVTSTKQELAAARPQEEAKPLLRRVRSPGRPGEPVTPSPTEPEAPLTAQTLAVEAEVTAASTESPAQTAGELFEAAEALRNFRQGRGTSDKAESANAEVTSATETAAAPEATAKPPAVPSLAMKRSSLPSFPVAAPQGAMTERSAVRRATTFEASDLQSSGKCEATLDEFLGGGSGNAGNTMVPMSARAQGMKPAWDKIRRSLTDQLDLGDVKARFGGSIEGEHPAGGMMGRLRSFGAVTRGGITNVAKGVTQIARKTSVLEVSQEDDLDGFDPVALKAKYLSDRTLLEALQGGDTVLVKGSWLIKRAAAMAAAGNIDEPEGPRGGAALISDNADDAGERVDRVESLGSGGSSSSSASSQPLPRRQELVARYPAAIWKVDELAEMLPVGHVVIVAVSYCWLSQEHPDPRGVQLRLLAHAVAKLLESSPLEDVAIFLDWCSLPQQPRSEAEEVSYSKALQSIHLWYAHQGTRVWMLSRPPEESELNTPFVARGWPSFERAVGEMTHKTSFLLDLGASDEKTMLDCDWLSLSKLCRPSRPPPISPEAFLGSLSQKTFGDEADRILVAEKYAATFREVVSAAEELSFSDVGWGDVEARNFAQILPRCGVLRKVALHGNRIGDVGATAIAAVIPRCKALQELWLTNNPLGKSKPAVAQLREAWDQAGNSPECLHF